MTETKPLAMVTGASSGIGFELAKQFAQRGFDLVVNAEDAGLENPTESFHNIAAWLVRDGFTDEEIAKVLGGNILRALRSIWP